MAKKRMSIAEELGIFNYSTYEDIPPAKKAWITMKATQRGLDPKMVQAGIKTQMGKKSKKVKKAVKKKSPRLINLKQGSVYTYSMKQGITKTPEFEKKGLAGFAINVGTKCDNDCLYCSTGAMLRMHPSFKEAKRDPFGFGYAIIDPDKPEKVAKNAKSFKDRGMIELCTTTDAYAKSARKNNLGRKCLEAVLNEDGWSVRILTKNHEVENDFNYIKKYKDRVIVGLSITATPDKSDIMQVVEKNASTIKDRMRVLRKAHRQGLRTFAMFCPLLPGIADSPKQIDKFIQFAEDIGAEEIFSEAVNRRGKGLILTQAALEDNGYVNEAKAVESVRKHNNWSQYTYDLLKNLQKSVRKYSSIKKLRFLLYSKNLLPEHFKEIKKNDKGVVWL